MNWTGRLARIFVDNDRLSLVLLITLFLWGAAAFLLTPKQYNPRITAPSFRVSVEFPGASRKEMLEQVTKPLENIIADIPGVEDIYSVTSRGGRTTVNVNFLVGSDADSAKITLTDRIQSNLNLAPLGIQQPLVQSIDPDDVPVLTLAILSRKQNPVQLRKTAFRVRDLLTGSPGATNIEVIGGRQRELSIILDPVRLRRFGVSVDSIEAALRRSNVYLPAGVIKQSDRYIRVESGSPVTDPRQLRRIVVVTGDAGTLRLEQVADVRQGQREIESHVRHIRGKKLARPGEHVVLLSVAKSKNANIHDVTTAIRERIKTIEREHQGVLAGGRLEVIVDEGRVAAGEINALLFNLMTAVAIVVVVLLVFLDRRSAIVTAISIPLTLTVVFAVAHLVGQNINRITLFALILSLGLLVDSAIVVTENITRTLGDDSKVSIRDRVVAAVAEVGPGLFMSTVTTVLAFIPMAFVTGMMGPYMGPIPFFVPTALVVSLVLSLTLIPWLAVRLAGVGASSTVQEPGRVARLTEAAGDWIISRYRSTLEAMLGDRRKRRMMLGGVAAALLLSFALPGVALVKFRMLPKADREQFFVYMDLPAGSSLERTNLVAQKLEAKLMSMPHVVMVQGYIGRPPVQDFNGLFRGVSARRHPHQATLRVGLNRPDQRPIKSERLVQHMRPQLNALLAGIPEARGTVLTLVEDPPGPPVLATFLVRVQGSDHAENERTARHLLGLVRKHIKGVVDTDVTVPEETKTLYIKVDAAAASRSRIPSATIVRRVTSLLSGRVIGIYHNQSNIEQEYITLRLDRKLRSDPAVLSGLSLRNELGIAVPLNRVARIEWRKTRPDLRRENRRSTVYIVGEMGARSVTYAGIDMLSLLSDYKLANARGKRTSFSLFGASFTTAAGGKVDISIGGEWELTLEVFRDLGSAMGVAIALIYLVLVGQFRSFRDGLIILSTIPLSLIGVLPGFMVLGWTIGLYFNATSMIGVIALAGIAVNNSIILMEYLNAIRADGVPLQEALLQAGLTRFRPIMLTTLTTILGSLTIVGDPVWAGLAFAIVMGLGVSSLLTLVVFPILFLELKGSAAA